MSLKDLKGRIKTIKSTSKTTKAMSLISAAQLSKVKHALFAYESFYNVMLKTTADIAFASRNQLDINLDKIIIPNDTVVQACQKFLSLENDYVMQNNELIILITAEKGLCGGFNAALANRALSIITPNTDVLCIGKKGYELIVRNRKKKIHILQNTYIELHLKQLRNEVLMHHVTHKILKLIASTKYSKVQVIYTEFVSMLRQDVKVIDLFPVVIPAIEHQEIAFDNKPIHMLQDILPHYLHSIIHHAILHSFKSESAKRMMTMDNAYKTSQKMQHELTLKYNRLRQTKVTMELIEIISGMTS